jgi:hypothetical protein
MLIGVSRRIWILAAAALVVLAAAAAVAVSTRLPEYLVSGHRCGDAEARFAAALARDPLLTQPPPGIKPAAKPPAPEVYQPCEGNGDDRYYGGALRAFNLPRTTPTLAEVEAYYRGLAATNGWQVTKPGPGELVGQKMIDGTAVVFDLSQLEHKEHYDAYWIELRYAELGSSRYLLTIQDM